MPLPGITNTIKKRKTATRNLYLAVIIGCIICAISSQILNNNKVQHINESREYELAYNRLARFKVVKNGSLSFYQFSVYHALYHKYLGKKETKEEIRKSLEQLRTFLDFDLKDSLKFTYYYEDIDFLKQYHPQIKSIKQYAAALKKYFENPDSVTKPAALVVNTSSVNKEEITPGYIKLFTPVNPGNNTELIINWIYHDEGIELDDDWYISNFVDNVSNNSLFLKSHSLIHESNLAQTYLELDPKGDSLESYLKNLMLLKGNKLAASNGTIDNAEFNVVNLLGMDFKFTLLFYLLAPLLIFFMLAEHYYSRTLNRILYRKEENKTPLLFPPERLLKGINTKNILIPVFTMLELIIRQLAIGIILYGCIFRYSFIENVVDFFNQLMQTHQDKSLYLFDAMNLLCLFIALSVNDSYKANQLQVNKFQKLLMHGFFIVAVLIIPVFLLLAYQITEPAYTASYFGTYAEVYLLGLLAFITVMYFRASKKDTIPVIYMLIAMLFFSTMIKSAFFTLMDFI